MKKLWEFILARWLPAKSIQDLKYAKPNITVEKRKDFKILFIDDNELHIINTLKENCGYDIKYKKDGLDNLYDASIYDIILCDLQGVNKESEYEGADLIKSLRNMYPNKQLILYTSGTLTPEQIEIIALSDAKRIKKGQDKDAWESILDEAILEIIDPTKSWERIKNYLEIREVKTVDIARFENVFVRAYEEGCTQKTEDAIKTYIRHNKLNEYHDIIVPIIIKLIKYKVM